MDINLFRSIDRILKPIRSKISGMIQKGVIHQEDNGVMQVSLGEGDPQDGIQYLQHVGFYSRPPAGSETLILFPNGSRQVGFSIASTSMNNCPVKLEVGEIALYAPGDRVSSLVLRKGGKVEIRNKDHELLDLVCELADKVNFLATKIEEMKPYLVDSATPDSHTADGKSLTLGFKRPDIKTDQSTPTINTLITNLSSFKSGGTRARP